MMGLGLIDDIKTKGLGFKRKFLIQILAAIIVIWFDIRLHFISPYMMAFALSVVWIVGITNAFNIIDIMDGLSSGVACIASFAFLLISLPSEMIYVNFCAAALAGACLGFIPFNLSQKLKIFMGDTGSLTIGFICASLALGTAYTKLNDIGLIAPLFILAIPIYDTLLVSFMRLQKGQSPFLGSKDHFALRLEFMGYTRKQILVIIYGASALLSLSAYFITVATVNEALMICAVTVVLSWLITTHLTKVEIH
jgi:UDP-GlcNAc:undecaprenyl-phosphate GlcNAc-1-phosphate transferase